MGVDEEMIGWMGDWMLDTRVTEGGWTEVFSGKVVLLLLVHPGMEVWAEGLRKNCQPDAARCLAVFFTAVQMGP